MRTKSSAKVLTAAITALMILSLVSIMAVAPVSALGSKTWIVRPITLESRGGTAAWATEKHVGESSVELHLDDGTTGVDYAEVSIPVDIALENLELENTSFWCKSTVGSHIPYFIFELDSGVNNSGKPDRINDDAEDSAGYANWAEHKATTSPEWQWGDSTWHSWADTVDYFGAETKITGVIIELPGADVGIPPFTSYVDDITVNGVTYELEKSDYNTIQQAIDKAEPGDTVLVGPGTYEESITINTENLTLLGAQHGVDPTVAGARMVEAEESVIDIDALEFRAIYITASDVTVDGFTVTGSRRGTQIEAGGGATITNNILSNGAQTGLYLSWVDGNTIANNVISKNGQQGVWLDGSSNNIIENNIVSNNNAAESVPSPDRPYIGAGIVLKHDSDGNILICNTVSGQYTGIDLMGRYGGCHNNTLTQNAILGNSEFGIIMGGVYAHTGTVITYNTIKGSKEGISVYGSGSSGTEAHYNNIENNAKGVINETDSTVDATLNWWGTTDGSAIVKMISGSVDYSPWLGFEVGTTPMTFHVDDTGTIQATIDAASPGDTVLVEPGTYEESVTIDVENLTLKSAELHKAIIDGGTRAAVLVKAEGVTVDGFNILSTYVSAVYAYAGSDNAKVLNNAVVGGGIYIDFSSAAEIIGNEVTNAPHMAIFCFGDTDIVIESNKVTDSANGILVHQTDGAIVKYNTVSGIGGDAAMQIVGSRNVVVEFNEITNNDAVGIQHGTAWWDGAYTPENNEAHYNNIVGNGLGVQNWADATFDATLNWWGTTDTIAAMIDGLVDYSPWLGSSVGTTPMTFHVDDTGTIQAAIDAAEPGDTVLVYPGTYDEYLEIKTENLTLKSVEGPESTVIDAGKASNAVGIHGSENVTIAGFTVTGGAPNGINVDRMKGCVVENNVITGNAGRGLSLTNSSDCTFKNNKLLNNGPGMFVVDSSSNVIENNVISGNTGDGIQIGGDSERNLIKKNRISDQSTMAGIRLRASNNTIEANHFENNKWGVFMDGAADNNSIVGNEVLGSGSKGIWIRNGSDGNTVENNVISGTTGDGIVVEHDSERNLIRGNRVSNQPTMAGIRMKKEASNNIVEANVFENNKWAVFLDGSADNNAIVNNVCLNSGDRAMWIRDGSDGNTIENNTVAGAGYAGIDINASENNAVTGNEVSGVGRTAAVAITDAPNTTVERNYVHGNPIGVKLLAGDVTGVRINNNNIENNAEFGVKNEAGVTVDATLNWWETTVESEIVEMISGPVDYYPWLDAAYPEGEPPSYWSVVDELRDQIAALGSDIEALSTQFEGLQAANAELAELLENATTELTADIVELQAMVESQSLEIEGLKENMANHVTDIEDKLEELGITDGEIWDALDNLRSDLEDIELTPGPQGDPGVAGPEGPEGPAGEPAPTEVVWAAIAVAILALIVAFAGAVRR